MFRVSFVVIHTLLLLLLLLLPPLSAFSILSRYGRNQTRIEQTRNTTRVARRRHQMRRSLTPASIVDHEDLGAASGRVAGLEAYAEELEHRLASLGVANPNNRKAAAQNVTSVGRMSLTPPQSHPPLQPPPTPPQREPLKQPQHQQQQSQKHQQLQHKNKKKQEAPHQQKTQKKALQHAGKKHQGRADHSDAPSSDRISADIIETNGFRSDEVAIFILSAGTNNIRWKQVQESRSGAGSAGAKITYYHTRALPAIATFGRHFPHLYFVFAGNGRANAERQIYSRCPLVEKRHDRSVVHCHERYVLVGNRCTNNRKGFNGPCCRLDVSLEFFLDNMETTFKAVKWWIFSDDDVYFRPHALVATLSTYDSSKPINLAGSYPSMFGFGASKLKDIKGDFCGDKECVHWYPWQVVSILSRSATEMVAPAIRARGLEEQCKIMELPGHDVGFGMLLWMYQLDMVFLSGNHFGPPHGMPCFGQLKDESKRTGCVPYGTEHPDSVEVRRKRNRDAILFHKVQNLTAAHDYVVSLGDNETQLGLNFHFPSFQVPGYGYTNFSRSFNPRVDMLSASGKPKKWRAMEWDECPKLWTRPEEHQAAPLGSQLRQRATGNASASASAFWPRYDYQHFEETFSSLSDERKKSAPKLNSFLAQLKPPVASNPASKDTPFREAASEFWLARKLKYPTCRALPY